MNHYEFLGILSGAYADTEVGALVSQIEETIKKHTETIHYVQNLGRRKLAYPIKHQGHGTYVLIEFDAAGDTIKKLDRLFRLTNELLRHCIVRRKTVGKPLPLERREEESRPARTYERTGNRRALGEELLGDTPTILASEEPAPATLPQEGVKEEAVHQDTPAPATATQSDDTSSASTTPPTTEPATEEATPPDDTKQKTEKDDETADDSAKKKNKKVSYEELDKKLNELLSDDII